VSLVCHEDRTTDPGAAMSGLILDPDPAVVGPRDEKDDMMMLFPDWARDPTPMTSALSPGELADPQVAPEFPWAKTGVIPAALQAEIDGLYQVWPCPPPHELEQRWACWLQSAPEPSGACGQTANWAHPVKAACGQLPLGHPTHPCQWARGAIPIPPSPKMVPVQ